MSRSKKIFVKIAPYRYYAKLHKRTETPKRFASYSSYRSYIFKEFCNQCVYCRKVALPSEESNFVVEHYRPRKYFPWLECEYENLYLSCTRCNSKKSSYWKDLKIERLLNPCEDVMSQHLKYEAETAKSLSNRGKLHIRQLGISDKSATDYRRSVNKTVTFVVEQLVKLSAPRYQTDDYRSEREELVTMLAQQTAVPVERINRLIK